MIIFRFQEFGFNISTYKMVRFVFKMIKYFTFIFWSTIQSVCQRLLNQIQCGWTNSKQNIILHVCEQAQLFSQQIFFQYCSTYWHLRRWASRLDLKILLIMIEEYLDPIVTSWSKVLLKMTANIYDCLP